MHKNVRILGGAVLAASLLAALPISSAVAQDACLATATKAVEASRTPITPQIPSLPINIAALKGKKIWFISPSQATPYALGVSQGVQAAGAAAGIDVQVFDGKAQPNLFNEGVSQAVAAKAAAIITYAIAPALISQTLPKAIEAGIPIMVAMTGQPAPEGVFASVNPDVPALGRLQADAALVQTGCKFNGAIVFASNFPILVAMKDATKARMSELCPACTLADLNVQLPSISTQLAPQTTSTMARLPQLNAFITTLDNAAVFMVPAIEQAQRPDVNIIGANGNPANLDFIRGGRVQTYDAAYPPPQYVGWLFFDQAARAVAKLPIPDIKVPVQMIDKSNVGPAGSGEDVVFPGLAGYQTAFKKIWGIF